MTRRAANGFIRSICILKLKPPFKLGEYNHIKIECIGNETKTWVNNIPVAYVVDTVDYKGFIGLQVHAVSKPEEAGKNVYFKNIKIQTTGLKPTAFPGRYLCG